MRSYPSTFNDSGISLGKNNNNNNSYARELSSLVSGIKSRNLKLSVPVKEYLYQEQNYNISNFNSFINTVKIVSNHSLTLEDFNNDNKNVSNRNYNENVNNITPDIINVLNNYNFQYNETLPIKIGQMQDGSDKKFKDIVVKAQIAPSLFNPIYGVNVIGMAPNTPLLNGISDEERMKSIIKETSDCSIKRLVLESKKINSILGAARYRYADFMYCRDLGKISNTHLITLRRFAHPIGDNIFRLTNLQYTSADSYDYRTEGDVGRLVTWFGNEENKLEDILRYSFGSTWKEMNAGIFTAPSKEDSEDRSIFGTAINTITPRYNSAFFNGTNPGKQSIWGLLGISGAPDSQERADYYNGTWDEHKIYTPKNTIQSTHLYEGKITFNHEFTLTFSYQLRAYDNINPKAAMLDLIGNVLSVCGHRGKFWGGENRIIGPPQNKSAWKKADALLTNTLGELGGVFGHILNGDWEALGGYFANLITQGAQLLDNLYSKVASDGIFSLLKKVATDMGNPNSTIGGAIHGILQNQLGRPSVYMLPSLLTGDDVGLWHVTIGNPLNPIMAFGNLILDNTEIVQSGPLGIDGFPTELKVICKLKHARPRDSVAISRMYTLGTTDLYYPLGSIKLSGLFNTRGDNSTDEYKDKKYEYNFKYEDLSDEDIETLKEVEMRNFNNALLNNNQDEINKSMNYINTLDQASPKNSFKRQIYSKIDAWDADSFMINMTNQTSWRDARNVIDEMS